MHDRYLTISSKYPDCRKRSCRFVRLPHQITLRMVKFQFLSQKCRMWHAKKTSQIFQKTISRGRILRFFLMTPRTKTREMDWNHWEWTFPSGKGRNSDWKNGQEKGTNGRFPRVNPRTKTIQTDKYTKVKPLMTCCCKCDPTPYWQPKRRYIRWIAKSHAIWCIKKFLSGTHSIWASDAPKIKFHATFHSTRNSP